MPPGPSSAASHSGRPGSSGRLHPRAWGILCRSSRQHISPLLRASSGHVVRYPIEMCRPGSRSSPSYSAAANGSPAGSARSGGNREEMPVLREGDSGCGDRLRALRARTVWRLCERCAVGWSRAETGRSETGRPETCRAESYRAKRRRRAETCQTSDADQAPVIVSIVDIPTPRAVGAGVVRCCGVRMNYWECTERRNRVESSVAPARVAAPSTPTTAGAWSSWIVRQNTLGSAHAARPDARLTPLSQG